MTDVPQDTAPESSAPQGAAAQNGAAQNGAAPAVTPASAPVADAAVAAAERIAFLALASELARDRKVLVVDDGASALAGIAAHLDSTELSGLDTPADGAYDLVVADLLAADDAAGFGVSQLARIVQGESGSALLRVPNRPEFAPLLDAFKASFARSLTMRQHNWVASALLDDAMFENDEPGRAVAATVRKLAAAEPGEELYTIVIGAHGVFPQFRPQLALTRSVVLRDLIAELQDTKQRQAAELAALKSENDVQAARLRELELELAWYDEHDLALKEKVEKRPWAMTLVSIWAGSLSLLRRARRVLGG